MSKVKRHSLQTGLIEGVEYVLASDHEAEVAALRERLAEAERLLSKNVRSLVSADQAEVEAFLRAADSADVCRHDFRHYMTGFNETGETRCSKCGVTSTVSGGDNE